MDHLELKAMREAIGITQTEMAFRLTMPRNTYLRWESGITKKLPHDLFARVTSLAASVAVHRKAVGEEMVLLTPGTHPEYYDKVRGRNLGWHVAANHPTGSSGPIKRKYLDAYVAGGRTAMEALQREDDGHLASDPMPRTAKPFAPYDAVDNPPYVHVGQDDTELEKRIQSFFSNPA